MPLVDEIDGAEAIYVTWTRLQPSIGNIWVPNHFVPLYKAEHGTGINVDVVAIKELESNLVSQRGVGMEEDSQNQEEGDVNIEDNAEVCPSTVAIPQSMSSEYPGATSQHAYTSVSSMLSTTSQRQVMLSVPQLTIPFPGLQASIRTISAVSAVKRLNDEVTGGSDDQPTHHGASIQTSLMSLPVRMVEISHKKGAKRLIVDVSPKQIINREAVSLI